MTAFYNEIDPKAAEWLRKLIAEGHIAPGVVDTRDIRDIRPEELTEYDQCHFFAGVGGWSLALRLAGWPDDRPVWTGSCPCQPFSAAGKRGGTADERHLWPAFHWLIDQCRPPMGFGEQVASRDGLGWLDLVCADLEGSGYAVGAADLCAAGVGAPHIRQRLWWGGVRLADAGGQGLEIGPFANAGRGALRDERETAAKSGLLGRLADAGHRAHRNAGELAGATSQNEGQAPGERRHGVDRPAAHSGATGRLADAGSEFLRREPGGGVREAGEAEGGAWERQRRRPDDGSCGAIGRLADADGRHSGAARQQRGGQHGLQPEDRGLGELGHNRRPGAAHGGWSDADWLFCRDGRWRPVEPGTQPLAHGLPARVGRLRGYGNAIVPQVAAEFIKAFDAASRESLAAALD